MSNLDIYTEKCKFVRIYAVIMMLLYRAIKKLRLHKWLYHITLPLHSCVVSITKQTIESAEQELQTIHPDTGDTCLCKNTLVKPFEYDLQIIIPAYNAAQYITECMDSILSQQTQYHFVIIVVNDGSTDETPQLLQHYTTHPNVILINQENRGFSGARNRALEHLIAKYVLFVDADDCLPPKAVDTLIQCAEKSQAEIVEGSFLQFDNNRIISSHLHQTQITNDWSILYGYPWGKVFRSELFANIHFPKGYWFEDTICTFMLYPQCKRIATVDNIVYKYRANNKGITSTSKGKIRVLDTLWISRQILHDADQYGITWNQPLYESFLNDLCINYSRIDSLHSPVIHKNVFITTCALREKYFTHFRTERPVFKPFETALINSDFGAYMLYGKYFLCT